MVVALALLAAAPALGGRPDLTIEVPVRPGQGRFRTDLPAAKGQLDGGTCSVSGGELTLSLERPARRPGTCTLTDASGTVTQVPIVVVDDAKALLP